MARLEVFSEGLGFRELCLKQSPSPPFLQCHFTRKWFSSNLFESRFNETESEIFEDGD